MYFLSSKISEDLIPVDVYEVFVEGKSIGYLSNEEEFLKLVDDKQEAIKKNYGVDKVYPPNGLEIEKITTYNENIKSSEDIYNTIEHDSPFTIEGYTITIKYKDESKSPVVIYSLKKEYFEDAFYNLVSAFVGKDKLNSYKNKTQEEITDEGTKITSIYWNEEITIKKSLISTDKMIFTNSDDLSKYLLFGTTEKQKTYTVKENDSIDNIIENIPKKDYFYKNKLKELSIELLYSINKTNNEDNYKLISSYKVEINSLINTIDYIIERLFIKGYIAETSLKKVSYKLSEINRMSNKWLDNKIDYDSKNK